MTSSLASNNSMCPVCGSFLHPNGPVYTVDQLFELWKPIEFSPETIEAHRRQSPQTQMYSCGRCLLDIFLPQIIGTPAFYVEAYSLNDSANVPGIFTYSEDKWDFHEALKYMPASRSALEVGCGPGNFLVMAGQCIQELFGIEYNEPALQSARSKGLKVFRSLEHLDIEKEHFDVAFSFHVLEHLADPVGFVKEILTWVKHGGTVGISVPNQDGPIKYIAPCITNMPPHHVTRWRLRTVKAMADRMGLVVSHVGFEPLLLQNHSYYSLHWLNQRVKGRKPAARLIRGVLRKGLNTLFGSLIKMNRKQFRFLRGQSMYISLLKP